MAAKIKAGEAFVVIGTVDKTQKGLRAIESRFQRMGQSLVNAGTKITLLGATMVGSFIKPVMDASNFQEQLNIFMVAFGDNADEVRKKINALAAATGKSGDRMLASAGLYKNLFSGFKIGAEAADQLSISMLAAATDMSSFFNVAMEGREGTLNRLRSALSGSSEVLDQFGINIKEMTLSRRLQEMFSTTSRTASEAQKAYARAVIIMETLKSQGVMGDANRTANKFANSFRNIKDQVWEVSKSIGNMLIPTLEKWLGYIRVLVLFAKEWVSANKQLIITFAKVAIVITFVGVSLIALGAIVKGIGMMFGILAATLAILKTPFVLIAALFSLTSGSILASVVALAALSAGIIVIAKNSHVIAGKWNQVQAFVKNIGSTLLEAIQKQRMDLVGELLYLGFKYAMIRIKLGWETMWAELVGGAAKSLVSFEIVFKKVWIRVSSFVVKLMNEVTKKFYQTIAAIAATAAKIPGIGGTFERDAAKFREMAGATQREIDLNEAQTQMDLGEIDNEVAQLAESIDDGVKASLAETTQEANDLLDSITKIRKEIEDAPDAPPLPGMPNLPDLDALLNLIPGGGLGATSMTQANIPTALSRGSLAAAQKSQELQRHQVKFLNEIAENTYQTSVDIRVAIAVMAGWQLGGIVGS